MDGTSDKKKIMAINPSKKSGAFAPAERARRITEIGGKAVAGVILLTTFAWHIGRLQFQGIELSYFPWMIFIRI